jgi:hypothetical protein
VLLENVIIFDIDGLRPDVLAESLARHTIPNIATLLGYNPYHHPLVCPAPSITFTCQGSILLGAQPKSHGIIGNQFFDRLGKLNRGRPKHYGLDVGDSLSYDDAVAVFLGRQGLANRFIPPDLPTLFERVAEYAWSSMPIHFMYGRGATKWIRPSVIDLARFKRPMSLLGLSPESFDLRMIGKTQSLLRSGKRPQLLLLYFMGLDLISHIKGPSAQAEYLERVLDPQIGIITKSLLSAGYNDNTTYIFVSDHGQIPVINDQNHALRVGHQLHKTPLNMYLTFQQLGRRLLRWPLPDWKADSILTPNGGFAHVYLRNAHFDWKTPPAFEQDVLACARGLQKANQTSEFIPLTNHALSAILVRNIEREGWHAPLLALDDHGVPVPLEHLFSGPGYGNLEEPVARLREIESPETGDIVLLANGGDGFYFGSPCRGNHGGLHKDESRCVFSIGAPTMPAENWARLEAALSTEFRELRSRERRSFNSLTDIAPAITRIIGEFGRKGSHTPI